MMVQSYNIEVKMYLLTYFKLGLIGLPLAYLISNICNYDMFLLYVVTLKKIDLFHWKKKRYLPDTTNIYI